MHGALRPERMKIRINIRGFIKGIHCGPGLASQERRERVEREGYFSSDSSSDAGG